MRDRVTVWLGVVGVLAVAVGLVLAVVRLWPEGDTTTPAARTPKTRTFVSHPGGFSVRVPEGMQARRNGRTARFSSLDRSLVVSVGPSSPGPLEPASRALVQRIRETYARVRVAGRRADRVDGRPAVTTYGRASNADRVPLRFVVVVVAAKPRTYALTAFTSSSSDPRRVVPVVNQLAGSFHVIDAGSSAKQR
jgi:hypothetical protein